jgi:pilus assembly protein CpaE
VLRIWLGGSWSDFEGLQAELLAHPSLAVVEDDQNADAVVFLTDGDDVRGDLAPLREHSQAPLVLVAERQVGDLLDAALELEASEVLLLPQTADAIAFAVQKAVAAIARRDTANGRSQVITVFSPKGGTGKSAIACNLAVALARTKRVLLVDLDLQFGDVAIMLGIQPERTIHELLTAPGSLDAEKIAGYASRHGRLDVLAAPLKPEDAESISDARVGELLRAARSGYDVVVVDTAPYFNGTALTTLDCTDLLLTVCTPDVPAMKNVRLALQTFELLSFDAARIRLALNRSSEHVGFRASHIASILEHPVAFELPDDPDVTVSVNRAQAAVDFAPAGAFSAALLELASALASAEPGHAATPARRRRFALGRRA